MNDTQLDQWLTTHIEELHDNLDDVLDLDAGLADARLPNLHTTLVRSLDDVIDIDTGLAPILQTSPPSDPMPSTPQTALGRFAIEFSARPLPERLATRTWFPRRELAAVRSIARLIHYARALDDILARARELIDAGVNKSASAHVLADARSLGRHLVDGLLSHDNTVTRSHARELARALDLSNLSVVLAHVLVVHIAEKLKEDLRDALVLPRDVAQRSDRAHASALALALLFDRDRDSGRIIVCTIFTGDFEGELIDAVDRLEQAVTDVTGADLTQVDLGGIPLDGLRWSAGTRWPPEWVEEVRSNSVELEPGLYEIRYGGVDAREYRAFQC